MLDSLLTNVFGRPKNKSGGRNSQHDPNAGGSGQASNPSNSAQMSGPFSMSAPQMPQPPNLPYPVVPPYPSMNSGQNPPTNYYPSLPFSQTAGSTPSNDNRPGMPQPPYSAATLADRHSTISPLDNVPFEAQLVLSDSSNLVSLDQLFKDIKKAADVVDRADAYLRSSQSDYDFKIEQGLIYP